MLQAKKEALENTARQKLVSIREQEIEYYTSNCRNIGNQAALVSGLAYSGIRYHYLLERKTNYRQNFEDSLEEMVFLSLLSITLGCALQTVYVAMLVALFGPQLALRGPDGSLHDAVDGMHSWNSVVLALFFTSLFLLQLSALSFAFGHSQMGAVSSGAVSATVGLSLVATIRSTFFTLAKFRLPKEARRRAIRRNSAQFGWAPRPSCARL